MPILNGRDFTWDDYRETSAPVCVVNETFARQVFEGENPIGKPCRGFVRLPEIGAERPLPSQIIGVAKDSKYTNPRGVFTQAILYAPFPFANTGRGQMILYARIAGDPGPIIPLLREEVWKADKDVPQFQIHTLEEEADAALVQDRLIAMLSGFFSILALSLAAVGLYGLFAFMVVQRTSEMGLRMALGALRGDVVWMVLKEAMSLVLIGIAIGIPLALATAYFASSKISGLLFGLSASDAATIGTATALLLAIATIAVYLPARRASRVDPMVALRNE